MPNQRLSRRSFLKGAALSAGSVAVMSLAACADDAGGDPAPGTGTATPDMPAWTHEADVVIAGGGIVGLVAAIRAIDLGASVIIVEANYCAGGHALVSGGHVHLGAGNDIQRRMGIDDSPDKYYLDHTMPFAKQEGRSVTKTRDRTNVFEIVRACANVHVEAFDFLLANGWKHMPAETIRINRTDSVPRTITSDKTDWMYSNPLGDCRPSNGLGLTRPLEKAARDKGVKFIMNHHMDKIYRDALSGNVVGLEASYTPRIMPGSTEPLVDNEDFLLNNIDSTETVYVKANQAVVVATGGSCSNWEMHSFFDPRFSKEHCEGVSGDPFSFQDGSGERAVIEVGGTFGATELGMNPEKAACIGVQYGNIYNVIGVGADVFPLLGALGFDLDETDTSGDGVICVNMQGNRFFCEDVPFREDPLTHAFFDAALSSVIIQENGEAKRVGGPIWGIFDDAWAKKNNWDMSGPPSIDWESGYMFKGDTLEELANAIVNKYYEQHKMPPENLVETVRRYNSFVDSGVDTDFGRLALTEKIATPPFYAAWSANDCHDTMIGVAINDKFQCLDINRQAIPHLYAGGECTAGQGMHGHGKNISNGYLIGANAVGEPKIQ